MESQHLRTEPRGPHPNPPRAFTLIELLVTILILSILMAIGLPLYLGSLQRSSLGVARANMNAIVKAEQSFFLRYHRYTNDSNELLGDRQDFPAWPTGPGSTVYTLYLGGETTLDGRPVPAGGVAVCGKDDSLGEAGDYRCYIPGVDTE